MLDLVYQPTVISYLVIAKVWKDLWPSVGFGPLLLEKHGLPPVYCLMREKLYSRSKECIPSRKSVFMALENVCHGVQSLLGLWR